MLFVVRVFIVFFVLSLMLVSFSCVPIGVCFRLLLVHHVLFSCSGRCQFFVVYACGL